MRKGGITEEICDLLVVSAFYGEKTLSGAAEEVNKALDGQLARILEEDQFKGKANQTAIIRPEGKIPAKRILVIGLGDKKKFKEDVVRAAAGAVFHVAKAFASKHVILEPFGAQDLSAKSSAKAMVEGLRLASYGFDKYKKTTNGNEPDLAELVSSDGNIVRQGQNGLETGELMAEGTAFARDLVNTPGEHMKPEDLMQAAKKIARSSSSIKCKVMDQDDLEEMGAGGILGISQGSDHEPYLVHLTYTPKKKAKKKIALVGKAITYDTGGYSLKPSASMLGMKCDMGGSASVLGAFAVLAKLEPNVEVHGIFAACENMVSGRAIRPGDVVTTMSGKTIEILNTDAEGRVTLADSLYYAANLDPDYIVDLATLTGACMVALGEEITGMMGNSDALMDKLVDASHEAGEKLWELPLEENYRKQIKGDIADFNNTGTSRYGGTITAALLLEQFVQNKPWVHLDIAGPSFAEKPFNSYTQKGATGVGVRTLLELVKSF